MASPHLEYQKAAVAGIRTAATLVSAGSASSRVVQQAIEGQTVPYVVCRTRPGTRWGAKGMEGTELTFDATCWDDDPDDVATLAAEVRELLEDWATPLSIGGGFELSRWDLELDGPLPPDRINDQTTYYGHIISVRVWIAHP